MNITGTVCFQSSSVLRRRVSFMPRKSVFRKQTIVIQHDAFPGYFGHNRSRCNGQGTAITTDDGVLGAGTFRQLEFRLMPIAVLAGWEGLMRRRLI